MKRDISEVVETHGRFRPKYVVTVDGREKSFSKKERERERKAEEARLRAEYDQDPDYVTIWVSAPRIEPKLRRRYMDAVIDMNACAKELNDACYHLSRGGYEVISISPITSSHANMETDYKTGGGVAQNTWAAGWGTGWGLSYTQGLVLVGRKKIASN